MNSLKVNKLLHIGLCVEPNENGFQRALKKVCNEYREMHSSTQNFNENALAIAKEFQPDIIFLQLQAPGIINEETAAELAKISWVCNWTGDITEELQKWFIDIGKHIQLTCFSNLADVHKAKLAGINSDYLQIGVDPDRYKIHHTNKYGPEIVAHFNDYGKDFFPLSQYRIDIVERLRQEFGNNFGVFGNFKGANGNFNASQIEESMNYNACKIAISCSHFNVPRYCSDRTLRILGSAAFCLSHNYFGIEEDFVPDEHLTTFDNLDELVEKCRYYLANDSEREQIASEGYYHVRKNYTFDNQAQNIVKLFQTHSILKE